MWRGTWQSVTPASVGWVSQARVLLPRDSSLYTQCRVHNGNLLGDVSINHTSAVDVVCDCVRMSALVCGGEKGGHVGAKACACRQRVG